MDYLTIHLFPQEHRQTREGLMKYEGAFLPFFSICAFPRSNRFEHSTNDMQQESACLFCTMHAKSAQ